MATSSPRSCAEWIPLSVTISEHAEGPVTIERSGYTPTGWPVQIQENDSVKLEMWLATDEERQQLVTALLAGTKV